jgi:diguanylate cyclase (GGDEF)-like protein/PAS domain S-box-containing protein
VTPQTIIVVEDNPITRKVLRLLLEGEGFVVVDAPDGKTALERAATVAPVLIVQDLRLPDITGFELLERLRALPGLAEVPIIAVTGFLPERATTPGTAEFTEVLIKPVAPSRLLQVIKALLVAHPVRPGRQLRKRVLLAEDDLVQRKLMRLLLGQWGFDVTEAVNGAEALRLALTSTPDLIVSDLLMPELDGLGLCLAVRRTAALAAVPVVLVSSHHLDEVDLSLVSHSGAIAIVSRSHDMAELGAALTSVMAHEAATRVAEPDRSVGEDITRLVGKLQREADARDALVESQAALSALLLFFERFADLAAQTAVERDNVDRTVDELLAAYLDASGASLGCAFLVPQDATAAALVLRSHIGYRGSTAADLPSFFDRRDLLERVLASGTTLELPSAEYRGADIDALLDRTDAASLLLVPLLIKDERLGVLVLGSHRSSSSLDRFRVAEAVRGPIAQALTLSRTVAELVTSRQAFRGIVDSASDGIVVADVSARITYANPAALSTFGYAAADLTGRSIYEILPFLQPGHVGRSGTGLRKDRTTFPSAVTITPFEDSPGHILHAHLVRDLGQRETLDQLATLVNSDGLTGLCSRRRFDEHMLSRLAEAQRYKISGALVLLDLDGFKAINDTYGHPAGDAVLKAVAAVVRAHTRGTDFIARLGGDELAVELPHTELAGAAAVAHKLLSAVREPIVWNGHTLRVGMSAGIAMYPGNGVTLEQLIGAADSALYESKRAGRNRVSSAETLQGAA